MNRYTFKGKNIENGEWVQGSLLKDSVYGCVLVSDWETVHEGPYDFWVKDNCAFEIIPETLCQCTGLQDKDGKDIFENDIDENKDYNLMVKYKNGKFHPRYDFGNAEEYEPDYEDWYKDFKVVGNKFDPL